jgi:hypothetical protein
MRCQIVYGPALLRHIILPCWLALGRPSPIRWPTICLEEITLA